MQRTSIVSLVMLLIVAAPSQQAWAQYSGYDAPFSISEGPSVLPLAGATLDNLSSQSDPLVSLQGASYVTGSAAGLYQAPNFGSALQPQTFGQGSYTGAIRSQYIAVFGNTTATLNFNTSENYFGLLWGSVDWFNVLSFYNGATLVGTITGSEIEVIAGQPVSWSSGLNEYVNITSGTSFNKIVIGSLSNANAFEFADIAFAPAAPAPPMGACMAFAAVLVLQTLRTRRRK